MPYRPSYAKGWGPLVLDHPKFKGYRPLVTAGPIGSRIELVRANSCIIQPSEGFKEKGLEGVVRIIWPDGFRYEREFSLTPKRIVLYSIEEVAAYLELLKPPELPHEEWRDDLQKQAIAALRRERAGQNAPEIKVRTADGPPLDVNAIFQLSDVVELWREFGLENATQNSPEAVTITRGQLDVALEAAFSAGRTARSAELPGDRARTQSAADVQARSKAAQAWWPEGAAWAQVLWNGWPTGWPNGDRRSLNKLGQLMAEKWLERPFSTGPARVDARDLTTRVIRGWIVDGTFKTGESDG